MEEGKKREKKKEINLGKIIDQCQAKSRKMNKTEQKKPDYRPSAEEKNRIGDVQWATIT